MNVKKIVALGLALAVSLAMSAGVAVAAAKAAPAAKVNINTATAQQLAELPGVGERLAARIVEYRQKSGPFKSPQELMNVQGVGEKNFARIQPHLTVGDGAPKAASK
jgi:competence protein ComEA